MARPIPPDDHEVLSDFAGALGYQCFAAAPPPYHGASDQRQYGFGYHRTYVSPCLGGRSRNAGPAEDG
jgi:hypothetical protein